MSEQGETRAVGAGDCLRVGQRSGGGQGAHAEDEIRVGRAELAASGRLLALQLAGAGAALDSAHDALLEGWVRALDLRDNETEGHSRRVCELTVLLAASLGIVGEELVHIRRGALLHDIGKLAVPDAVLRKAGPLDAAEWAAMREHPRRAYELLRPIPFLAPALDIPYAHHERWDGTGYPRGLRGDAIPFAARLFAVVDVYDALTSDRPYRAALSSGAAVAYLREQAGRHFDPCAVDAFVALLGEEAA